MFELSIGQIFFGIILPGAAIGVVMHWRSAVRSKRERQAQDAEGRRIP